MNKIFVVIFALLLPFGSVFAQQTPIAPPYSALGGMASVSVTNSSAATALPSTNTAYRAVTLYNSGLKDGYFAVGDSTVVATTSPTGAGAGKLLSGTYLTLWANGTHIAFVTGGSDTTTIQFYQASGPIQFGQFGGSSGGITALTGDVTASGPGSVPATLATAQPGAHTWAAAQVFAAGISVSPAALTVSGSAVGVGKMTASGTAPGAAGSKIEVVCGTNAGTLKVQVSGGTSTTPVVMADNIGSGATGC